MKYLFKFLRTGLLSNYDKSKWIIGKWRNVEAPTKECVGLNASEYIQDALKHVNGEILAIVEYGGKVIKSKDKYTCEKMKIIKKYKWNKEDSVKLAIYCAELCIKKYEDKYPNDIGPREAIKAAKRYLKNPSHKNKVAADAAAYAADYAARSAFAAADYASRSAFAARSVFAAAYAAVYASAHAACAAADYAAYASDTDCVDKKIHNYILKMKNIKLKDIK